MYIYRNAIIRITKNHKNPVCERVVWIDLPHDAIYVFGMDDKHQFPEKKSLSAYQAQLDDGSEYELIDFSYIRSDFRAIEFNEIEIASRNKSWEIIEPIVTNIPDVFDKKARSRMIEEAMDKHRVSRNHIVRRMMIYWKFGMTINALATANLLKGGRGKSRKYSGKKKGRPVKSEDIINIGKNVTQVDKGNIMNALKKYYLTKTCLTYKATYRRMLMDSYNKVEGEAVPLTRGNKPVFRDGSTPSYSSFMYWAKKYINGNDAIIKRKGYLEKSQNHSAVLGNQTQMAQGPGDIFQIDATIADLAIVDAATRRNLIGRPVVYMVIDVFTRCIAGIHVCLEGPSWQGAKMALYNCTQNKKEYCHRHGIEIEDFQWPVRGLPRRIIADRGEMASSYPDVIKDALGVELNLCAPGHASWKGIVESKFRQINNTIISWIDEGKIQKHRKPRLDDDLSKKAKFTIHEFEKMILACVLEYNSMPMPSYPVTDLMRINKIDPVPEQLWSKGIQVVGGFQSIPPKALLVTSLMHNKTVTISKNGLVLNKKRYTNEEDLKNDYYSLTRENPVKVRVSYDPDDMREVYVVAGNEIKTYTTVFEDGTRMTEDELQYQIDYDNYILRANQERAVRNMIITETIVDEIKQHATKENLRLGNTEKKNTKNKRANRADENVLVRKESREDQQSLIKPPPIYNNEQPNELPLPDYENNVDFG